MNSIKTKKPISEEFKISPKKLEELLLYEIRMFKNTYKELIFFENLNQFKHNLLIESLALHARVLVDFFYCDQKKHKCDIIVQDLLPSNIVWSKERPQLPKILKEARQKANKQLAHLSLDRIKLRRKNKHGWKVNEIIQEMNKIIKYFYDIKKSL